MPIVKLIAATPIIPFKPSRDKVVNHNITFEIDGRRGQRTLLQLLAILHYESNVPRDDFEAFRSRLEDGKWASLENIDLSPEGFDECFDPNCNW